MVSFSLLDLSTSDEETRPGDVSFCFNCSHNGFLEPKMSIWMNGWTECVSDIPMLLLCLHHHNNVCLRSTFQLTNQAVVML